MSDAPDITTELSTSSERINEKPVSYTTPPAPRWGFMEGDAFVPLPMQPFKTAGLQGPPPFDVKLPSGETRHIILEPNP